MEMPAMNNKPSPTTMRISILTILFVLSATLVQSQIHPFKGTNGKMGFKNKKQKTIAPPKYTKILVKDRIYVGQGNYISREIQIVPEDLEKGKLLDSVCISCEFGKLKNISIGDFINSKPYILVSDSINYGILDPKTAKELTEIKYENIEITHPRSLSEPDNSCNTGSRLCIVHLNGKTGAINAKTGKEIIPIKYIKISQSIPFLVQLADKHGLMDSAGREILPVENQTYFISRRTIGLYHNKRWVFTDLDGKIIPEITMSHFGFRESDTTTMSISKNLAVMDVNSRFDLFRKILIKKPNGNIINHYSEIAEFKGGHAKVKLLFLKNLSWKSSEYVEEMYGLIDSTGKEIIDVKYDNLIDFGDLIWVRLREYVVNEDQYGQLEFSKEITRHGVINKAGKEIIPIVYSEVTISSTVPRRIEVALNGKRGILDATGKEMLPVKYDEINLVPGQDLIAVKLNDKWGYVDSAGKEVTPLKYDEVGDFYEQLARVRINQKWGFIDKSGREVIPLKYAAVSNFSEGLVKVSNAYWGFIDIHGKEVIQLKYEWTSDFKNGKARVQLREREFVIDKTGTAINK
jgi:hypothetical protein